MKRYREVSDLYRELMNEAPQDNVFFDGFLDYLESIHFHKNIKASIYEEEDVLLYVALLFLMENAIIKQHSFPPEI
jgi:hypothetical protein